MSSPSHLDVSGPWTELVDDNQDVKRGGCRFCVDPERNKIALKQAESVVEEEAAAEQLRVDFQGTPCFERGRGVSAEGGSSTVGSILQAEADLGLGSRRSRSRELNSGVINGQGAVNGRITNMNLRPGAYVTMGRGVFA